MTSQSLVKYIVLKQGTRGYTLASIHPKGKHMEAVNNAKSLSAREKCNTLVCIVLNDIQFEATK